MVLGPSLFGVYVFCCFVMFVHWFKLIQIGKYVDKLISISFCIFLP